jgi:hypothetical protein
MQAKRRHARASAPNSAPASLVPCVAHIAEIAPDGRFAAKDGDAREPVVLARTGHIR